MPCGSVAKVFGAFLKLGLTSFGGPIAHVGYFHREFVERRRWVDEAHYAQLLALSQFLPGPASSQVGFSLGIIRAGWLGGLAAFVAFTLPSALLMFAFAYLTPRLDRPYGQALLHGFKLVAVAVVAHGVVTMAQRLTPDARRIVLALLAAAAVLWSHTAIVQIGVVIAGAIGGLLLCRHATATVGTTFDIRYGTRVGIALLVVFGALLVIALWPDSDPNALPSAAKAFYRTGALVFGGAHVVLPLLEEAVVRPDWVSASDFFAGYGAAQAVPGPMFSLAAFLGARLEFASSSTVGAVVALLAMFLPGLLLAAGVLPLWNLITRRPAAASALAGINAAVVGLLAAALYDPVIKTAVVSPLDLAIAGIGFALLIFKRTGVLWVLLWCVSASLTRVALGTAAA